MFKYAAPWVVVLPIGLLSPFYRIWGKRRPLMAYLWLWFVVGLLLFTVSKGKRPHYILPQMPAAAILMGIVLDDLIFARRAFSKLFAGRLVAIHAIGLVVAALACPIYVAINHKELPGLTVLAGVGIALFVGLAVFVLRIGSPRRHLAVPVFVIGLGIIELFGLSIYDRSFDTYKETRDFALKIRQLVPQGRELFVYGDLSKVFLHYYGQPVPIIDAPEAVRSCYLQGHWVAVLRTDLPEECRQEGCRIVFTQEKKPEQRNVIYGYLLHMETPSRSFDPESPYGT
jgi:4-amino-4-deoxy-L-arabinose transferase-like glycosyltransferase